MDALIERYKIRLLAASREIAADKSIPIKERIVRVVMTMNLSDGSGREIMKHIHKPQNALMHQKLQKVIINTVTPILTGIIQEGIEQGQFSTPFPYECVEMILTYANVIFSDDYIVDMSIEERSSRIKAFIFNVERLLGAESGSLAFLMQLFGNSH
jgi:hypothetical protein